MKIARDDVNAILHETQLLCAHCHASVECVSRIFINLEEDKCYDGDNDFCVKKNANCFPNVFD